MSFIGVLIAVLLVPMLPFFVWSIATMKKGIQGTRDDIEASTSAVKKTLSVQSGNVQDLVSSQERLIERIQHLEAIVTSEDWDTLAKEKQDKFKQDLLGLDAEPILTDEAKAASMAKKVH